MIPADVLAREDSSSQTGMNSQGLLSNLSIEFVESSEVLF